MNFDGNHSEFHSCRLFSSGTPVAGPIVVFRSRVAARNTCIHARTFVLVRFRRAPSVRWRFIAAEHAHAASAEGLPGPLFCFWANAGPESKVSPRAIRNCTAAVASCWINCISCLCRTAPILGISGLCVRLCALLTRTATPVPLSISPGMKQYIVASALPFRPISCDLRQFSTLYNIPRPSRLHRTTATCLANVFCWPKRLRVVGAQWVTLTSDAATRV